MVGAGPSGGELGRLLAQAGVDVVLVDRLIDLYIASRIVYLAHSVHQTIWNFVLRDVAYFSRGF